MTSPEIVDHELLEKLLRDKKNDGQTAVDIVEIMGSNVRWYRNLNESTLDEIISRTSEATLRVL
jgi:hypothetical protein